MVRATSKVLLFISWSYCWLVDSGWGYAIDDSSTRVTRTAVGDYVVAHEHPTKEDLFDLDWDQVDERYDPRLLSEDLISESQVDADHKDGSGRRQAEHCYFEARKYEHGQKIVRQNPCEACVCVDGETFCWWKQFETTKKATTNTMRKKAKLFTKPFSATKKTTTVASALHHPPVTERKRVGSKKLPLNILNFPHNLPVHLSEIDLMIESDGLARSTTKLAQTTITTTDTPLTTSSSGSGVQGPLRLTANRPITPFPVTTTASTTNYRDGTGTGHELNNNNTPSDPTSNEHVVASWSPTHPLRNGNATTAINRDMTQQPSLELNEAVEEEDVKASEGLKDQVNGDNVPNTDFDMDQGDNWKPMSGHQMTENKNEDNDVPNKSSNKKSALLVKTQEEDKGTEEAGNGKRSTTNPSQAPTESTTTTTTPAAVQETWEQEEERTVDIERVDEDFIRKVSIDDDSPLAKHYIITSSGDIENIPLANQHLVSQFRENFINEVMPLNSVEKVVKVDMPPPTLILDTYPSSAMLMTRPSGSLAVESTAPMFVNDYIYPSTVAAGANSGGVPGGIGIGPPTRESVSSSYATKIFIPSGLAPSGQANRDEEQQQQTSEESAQLWNRGSAGVHKESVAASKGNSNNKTQDPECIVMGQTYKVGMVLPQEVGNCLQCVCVEGPSAEEPARVTCSPHNCPPLILPDLFDTTGY